MSENRTIGGFGLFCVFVMMLAQCSMDSTLSKIEKSVAKIADAQAANVTDAGD